MILSRHRCPTGPRHDRLLSARGVDPRGRRRPETLPDGCGARVDACLGSDLDHRRHERARTPLPIPALRPCPGDGIGGGKEKLLAGVGVLVGEHVVASEAAHELDELLLVALVNPVGGLQAQPSSACCDGVDDELFQACAPALDVRLWFGPAS